MNRLTTFKNKISKQYALCAFLLGLLLSVAILVPVMVEQGGIFLYYGDFNAQEVPFYQLVHDELRAGNFKWTHLTDLGTPIISSYLFYLIGSPFFWITMPFPSEAVPYLLGPLFMLKFALASLTAYIYLKRYVKNPTFAVAGALMYAFSGFSIYNIFFFHFHEPIIVFPLLLWAVDKFMYDGKKAVVAVMVFVCCIVNYYFFAGMAVFTIIYWLMLTLTGTYKITLKKILLFVFEVVLGFCATAFIILPTVLFISGNPRLESFPDGYGAIVYDIAQRYAYIVLSFFFPPELAAQPNFAPDVDANWASVSGWLPLAGMTAVIGYMQLRKRDWLKKLISILILFALVPALNSTFQLLNSSIYYARWYYMFTLVLILATVKALENEEIDWCRAFIWSASITAGIALFIGLMPKSTYDEFDVKTTAIGLAEYRERFWIYVAIALVTVLIFALIVFGFRNDRVLMARLTVVGVCVCTVLSSTYVVQNGNSLDEDEKKILKNYAINKGSELKIDDINEVRSDFFEAPDNLGMYWQIQSINAFHSVVPTGIMNFYELMGITRDVASRPSTNDYAIRGLLSCKYLFDDVLDNDEDEIYRFKKDNGRYRMPGWKYLKTVNGCDVYENRYYIPMGFTFDSFLSEDEFKAIDGRFRTEAILKTLVLSNDDLLKYKDITGYTAEDIEQIENDKYSHTNNFVSKSSEFQFGSQNYYADCEKLKKNSAENFHYTDDGFEVVFDNKGKDNLLFLSIPYDKGWKAEVNGKEVEVVKAFSGLCAVRVEGGKLNKISFKYEQEGFRTGIIISVICGIIFVMYISALVFFAIRRKNRGEK